MDYLLLMVRTGLTQPAMMLQALSVLLAFIHGALSAHSGLKGMTKRAPSGPFHLVAYGVTPSSINIFYSDGMLHALLRSNISSNTDPGFAYAGNSSLWPYGSRTTDIACE